MALEKPDMDRRERERLQDEIDRGVRNVGIYKVDGDALERENRSPIFKGAAVGFGLGGSICVAYFRSDPNRSPLGLFLDDYVLAGLLIWVGGTVVGAALGWLYRQSVPTRRKPPTGAPGG